MALTQCVQCGKEISTEAKTCPHCGKITSSGPRVSRRARVIVTLIAMAVILLPVLDMMLSR
jgi:predicted nucleic acid-binding Zn ribbon protein